MDDVESGRLAVAQLLEQGYSNIALVGGPGTLQQVRDRRLGAQIARSQHPSEVQLLTISTPGLDSASGVSAATEIGLLPPAERPTAVFAANDLLAIGLLQGFVSQGMQVPADIAIIGYDDISFAASAAVPLSSVRQPRRALGCRAAELLFEEIEAVEQDLPHEHQAVQFNPELVVRRSTVVSPARRRLVG